MVELNDMDLAAVSGGGFIDFDPIFNISFGNITGGAGGGSTAIGDPTVCRHVDQRIAGKLSAVKGRNDGGRVESLE